jgi:hypothetical protein
VTAPLAQGAHESRLHGHPRAAFFVGRTADAGSIASATSTPSCLTLGAQRGPRRCRFVVLYNNGPALRVSALQIEAIMPESVPVTGTDSVCMAKP